MTAMMRALVVRDLAPGYGGTSIEDWPVPQPGPGEVRVAVKAAAINFPDLLMTRGEYQLKPPLPFIPGLESAGILDAVGAGVDVGRVGEEVVVGSRTNSMAQYVVVAADVPRPKPANLSWEAAAGYRGTYLTAYVSLVRRGQLQPGEWVLVHGAAGGVGLACVDMAKAMGARVIAAGSSDAKLAIVNQLYAPDAIVNVREGFREQVKAITGGAGADIIIDPVGGDVFDESTRCIAFDGRLLVVGFTSGRIPTVSVNMPLIKGFSVIGVRAGEYGRRFPDRGAENIAAIDKMAADGTIRPHVHAALPLEEWRSAFDLLANREVVGKAVLIP